MVILGIDPGVARVGYGVIHAEGDRIVASAHGCIETAKTDAQGDRLLTISRAVAALIRKFRPEAVAVEKLFFQKNAKTAIAVGEGRGVVLAAAAEARLRVVEMTPGEVKLAVTGYGAAEKRQVQEMVRRTLRLAAVPEPDDAADALAIAMTGMRMVRHESWTT